MSGPSVFLREPGSLWLVCVVFYLALGPTQAPFYTPSLYDNARLLQVFVLSVLSLSVLALPTLRVGISRALTMAPRFVQLALLVFTSLTLISAHRAAMPMMAVQEVALLLLLGLLALSIAAMAAANRGAVDLALLAAYEGSVLIFIVVFWMAQVAAIHMNQPFEWIHPFITFANVRHFSQFQAYTLPLLVLPLASPRVPFRWRAAAFLVATHWWTLQFAVGTRAIWFAAAFSAAISLLVLRRESSTYLKWQGLVIWGGGLLYLVLNFLVLGDAPGLSAVGSRGFDTSNRRELWWVALGMVRESPLLGVGPMHFSFRNFEWAAHPHNSILQLAAEYGLPATVIMVALAAYLLWRCAQWAKTARSEDEQLLNVGLFASLLMGLLDSLVSGNTLMPVSQMTLFVLIGWIIGRNASSPLPSVPVSPQWGGLAIASLSLVCAISVSLGALHYYEYWDARKFFVPAGASHPRHWEEGHWPVGRHGGSSFSPAAEPVETEVTTPTAGMDRE